MNATRHKAAIDQQPSFKLISQATPLGGLCIHCGDYVKFGGLRNEITAFI